MVDPAPDVCLIRIHIFFSRRLDSVMIARGLVPDLVNQNLDPHPCRGVRLKIKKFMRWVSYQINYLNCVTYNGHPVDTAVWPNG